MNAGAYYTATASTIVAIGLITVYLICWLVFRVQESGPEHTESASVPDWDWPLDPTLQEERSTRRRHWALNRSALD